MTSDDLKRAEEILSYIPTPGKITPTIGEAIARALAEERARTLNSEAVQGLISYSDHKFSCNYNSMNRQCKCGYIEVIEKFQQFKDGK